MKSLFFIGLAFFVLIIKSSSQCTFESIFPLQHGTTRFMAITTIASLGSLKEDNSASSIARGMGKWKKYDYLDGDSVFITNKSYEYILHNCFNGNQNFLHLSFADDKLYSITNTLFFSNDQFGKLNENYNHFVSVFKRKFPSWDEILVSDKIKKEQRGMGFRFYPLPLNQRDNVKIEYLEIWFNIEYDWQFDSQNNYVRTGNVSFYQMNIDYINLKGTKLTNKGF